MCCDIILLNVCFVVSYCTTSHFMLCHGMSRCVVWCYVMLCYVMSYYVML